MLAPISGVGRVTRIRWIALAVGLMVPTSAWAADCDPSTGTSAVAELGGPVREAQKISADELFRPMDVDRQVHEAAYRLALKESLHAVLDEQPPLMSNALLDDLRDIDPWIPDYFARPGIERVVKLEGSLVGMMFDSLVDQDPRMLHELSPREQQRVIAMLALEARRAILVRYFDTMIDVWASSSSRNHLLWKAYNTPTRRAQRIEAMLPRMRELAADFANTLDCTTEPCQLPSP